MTCRNDADGVSVAHASAPSLHAHDLFAFFQNTELDGIPNAPSKTTVDVFLPIGLLKIWLLLREEQWVDSTIQVRVLLSSILFP